MTNVLTLAEEPLGRPGVVAIHVAGQSLPERLTVAISRKSGDRTSLGPQGWQAKPYAFTPEAVEAVDGGRILLFGPSMTSSISVDASVTVSVPELGIAERHFWPSIASAPDGTGLDISFPRQKSGATPTVEILTVPVPSVGTPAAEDTPTPETGGSAQTVPEQPPRRWMPAAGLALLLLAVATGGLVWFYAGDDPAVVSTVATSPPSSSVASFQERYDVLRRGEGRAPELLALGLEAMAAGEKELGFQAVTLSADRGLDKGQILVGEWYDPLSQADGPVEPNAATAALYYRDAADGGNAEAGDRLRHLCEAQRVQAGDPAFDSFDAATYCTS